MAKAIDYVGTRSGKLTVVAAAGKNGQGEMLWRCLCECGQETAIRGSAIRLGRTKSCGCLRAEVMRVRAATHGQSHTSEYRVWAGMLSRCQGRDIQVKHRKDYAGRGIRVCLRWSGPQGFENFLRDMGPRPSLDYSIERIDNNGDYEPGNCRWATKLEQGQNKRNNRYMTVDGVTMTMTNWAKQYGISPALISKRLTLGWSARDAITRPSASLLWGKDG